MEGGFKSEVLGLRGGSFEHLKFDCLFEKISTDEGEAAEQMTTNTPQMNKGSTIAYKVFMLLDCLYRCLYFCFQNMKGMILIYLLW